MPVGMTSLVASKPGVQVNRAMWLPVSLGMTLPRNVSEARHAYTLSVIPSTHNSLDLQAQDDVVCQTFTG